MKEISTRGDFVPPGNNELQLETFLVVTMEGGGVRACYQLRTLQRAGQRPTGLPSHQGRYSRGWETLIERLSVKPSLVPGLRQAGETQASTRHKTRLVHAGLTWSLCRVNNTQSSVVLNFGTDGEEGMGLGSGMGPQTRLAPWTRAWGRFTCAKIAFRIKSDLPSESCVYML